VLEVLRYAEPTTRDAVIEMFACNALHVIYTLNDAVDSIEVGSADQCDSSTSGSVIIVGKYWWNQRSDLLSSSSAKKIRLSYFFCARKAQNSTFCWCW